MGQSSREVAQRAYDAFAVGDIDTVVGLCADDITFHIPGSSPLSGAWSGHDGILEFFAKAGELSAGTLAVPVDAMLADGERVVVFTTVTARRNGRSASLPNIHVLRVVDGKIAGLREYQGDQTREDEFWSS
jgi:uncharacterized protein